MSIGYLARNAAIAGATLFILALGHPLAARADVETCGAHLRPLVQVSPQPGSTASTYAFVLRADTERAVKGEIVADTDHGWFSWSFPMIWLTLQPSKMTIRESYSMTGKDYESVPLYVSFPPGTVVHHAWVEHAQTSGEHAFGFDALGDASCTVDNFGDPSPYDPPVATPVPTTATVIAAEPTDPRFTPTCDHPFAKSTFSDVPSVQRPQEFSGAMSGAAVVAVAITSAGKVLDTWPISTSGNFKWDMAATIALRDAKYTPPISYCIPVATTIYFVMVYRP